MKRATALLLGIFIFGLTGEWAFALNHPAIPVLPSKSFISSDDTKEKPKVLNVEEDVKSRTLNSKRWLVEYEATGVEKKHKGFYTELRSGLHYNAGTPTKPRYEDADTTIVPTKDGAKVSKLSHPIQFKNRLSYGNPVIEQKIGAGQSFSNSPAFIVYHDRSTDQSVVIARSQPSTLAFEKNIATYADAFDHLSADIRYTVDYGSLEQDVLLYEKPLPPSAYGLNDETTVLAVLTRLFDLEDRIQGNGKISTLSSKPKTLVASAQDLKGLKTAPTTAAIAFERDGKVLQQLGRTYAFQDSKTSKNRQSVEKRLVTLQGIHFLSEEIPATYLQEKKLPVADRNEVAKAAPVTFDRLQVAENKNFSDEPNERFAQMRAPPLSEPVILDYTSIPGGTFNVDFTFESGQTYFITGPVSNTGTTTIEGKTFIKYDDVASGASLDLTNPVFTTQSSHWAYFTSKYDDTLGESIIVDNTISPSPGDYGLALNLPGGTEVHNILIRFATSGIQFVDTGVLTIRDSAFVQMGQPVMVSANTGDATINLNNILIIGTGSGPVINDQGNILTITAHNFTFFSISTSAFATALTPSSTFEVTDSLFVSITGTNVFAGTYPTMENYNAFFNTPQTGTGANDIPLSSDPILPNWFLDQTQDPDPLIYSVIDAGSGPANDAGLYRYTTNKNRTPEATTPIDIGFHWQLIQEAYSLFATNSIWIKDNANIPSGFIGVDNQTAGPWLNASAQLTVGTNVSLGEVNAVGPRNYSLLADTVEIGTGSVAEGDVHYNVLTGLGTINGSPLTPLPLPLLDGPPFLPSTNFVGIADIDVADGGSHALALDDYRDVVVGANATLIFSEKGLYNIRSITAGLGAQLVFSAPAWVNVEEDLVTGDGVVIESEAGANVSPHWMVFAVYGTDGATGAIDFGDSSIITARLYAPNGTIETGLNSQLFGTLYAQDILVEESTRATLVSADPVILPGNPLPMAATPTIAPNGGLFVGSVAVTLATATAGASIFYTTDGTVPTTSSTPYTVPFTLTESPTTITVQAIAVLSGFLDSAIARADFNSQPPDPVTFTPSPGKYLLEVADITLSTQTVGATIHYTIDGSTPTPLPPSIQYSAPFTISSAIPMTILVQAIAVLNGSESSVTGVTYDIVTDPYEVAPIQDTIYHDVFASTQFLYTGPNATQTNMTATIEPAKAAVVRGKVLQSNGTDLTGVKVTIKNRSDYGETLSRTEDAFFDLVVNGGGQLIVQYEKTGYLSAQRMVNVPVQDYVVLDDVVLVTPDIENTLNLTAPVLPELPEMLVAQSTLLDPGTSLERQATLMYIEGIIPTMVINGVDTSMNVATFEVRATEYSADNNGPEALPVELPPNSAYTYALEVSVAEARTAEAEKVKFDQPVIIYVQDFLSIPVGTDVPAGDYDFIEDQWVPSEIGTVIEITGVTGGLADLDLGPVHTLVSLGITDEEREKLATSFPTGETLWRVSVTELRMPVAEFAVNAFSLSYDVEEVTP